MSKSDQILLGEKLLKDELDKLNVEANRLFEAQTIETDREKFVNNYLTKKGESLLSKEKSNLLEEFKDKPLILSQLKEFYNSQKSS